MTCSPKSLIWYRRQEGILRVNRLFLCLCIDGGGVVGGCILLELGLELQKENNKNEKLLVLLNVTIHFLPVRWAVWNVTMHILFWGSGLWNPQIAFGSWIPSCSTLPTAWRLRVSAILKTDSGRRQERAVLSRSGWKVRALLVSRACSRWGSEWKLERPTQALTVRLAWDELWCFTRREHLQTLGICDDTIIWLKKMLCSQNYSRCLRAAGRYSRYWLQAVHKIWSQVLASKTWLIVGAESLLFCTVNNLYGNTLNKN